MNELQYFDQLRDIMVRSGQLVMQHFRGDYTVFEKKGYTVATSVDIENENFLKMELANIVPSAGFIAEESGISGLQSDLMWVIDPLDGTKNFIKGIPHFCIIVALTYCDEPIVAAIYQPCTQEFYYAEKGKGFWVSGNRLESVDRSMKHNVALVHASHADVTSIKLKLKENKIQISKRYFGSAGMDAIYLAMGNIDFLVFQDIAWWDVAAGMLCIDQAGGLKYSYKKSLNKVGYGSLRAGNPLLFDDSSW